MNQKAFEGFVPETLGFLKKLAANNNREWFSDHKKDFDVHYKQPASEFADELSLALTGLTGHLNKSKVFRIYRDVRFSKDKTPYNTHLHVSFTPDVAGATPPMWFFGVDSERLSLGCGVFGFEKHHLQRFRSRVVGDEGDQINETVEGLRKSGVRFNEPELKRVPAGYAKDHQYGHLLRHKGLSGWWDYSPNTITRPDLVNWCVAEYEKILPLYLMLNQ